MDNDLMEMIMCNQDLLLNECERYIKEYYIPKGSCGIQQDLLQKIDKNREYLKKHNYLENRRYCPVCRNRDGFETTIHRNGWKSCLCLSCGSTKTYK